MSISRLCVLGVCIIILSVPPVFSAPPKAKKPEEKAKNGVTISSAKTTDSTVRKVIYPTPAQDEFLPPALPSKPDWANPPAAVTESTPAKERVENNGVVLERLGAIFTDGAGPMVIARAGDWRLFNNQICLTFASVEDPQTTGSFPVGGWRALSYRKDDRVPGALIDISLPGAAYDTLARFTQAIGVNEDGGLVKYDTAEPIRRGEEVGLRLEGSPFLNAPVRLETIYWLAAGRNYVLIESRLLNLPSGQPPPVFCDAGEWGKGLTFIERTGFTVGTASLPFSASALYGTAAGISTLLEVEHGLILGKVKGEPSSSRTLWSGADPASAPDLNVLKREGVSTKTLALVRDQRLLAAQTSAPPTARDGVWKRRLWAARGQLSAVRELAQAHAGMAMGTVNGTVVQMNGEPAPYAQVNILTSDAISTRTLQTYSTGEADATGHYSIKLPPGRYFSVPVTRFNPTVYTIATSFDITPGAVVEKKDVRRPLALVHIRAVDDATSQPLAVQLIFQRPGGERVLLAGPGSARAVENLAFCPPQGTILEVPRGQLVVGALHGIEYEILQIAFSAAEGSMVEVVMRLKRKSPISTGWTSLLPGLRTLATPGVSTSPEDAILMAVAHGLQWVTSGDFDVVTDFTPVIRKLGFEKLIHSSGGFRTTVPLHPEWGQFLVFPVTSSDPPPAKARKSWNKAATRHDLLAALRKLYPKAVIQSELPYALGGDGFLGFGEKNEYEAMGKFYPDEDLSVDALDLYPPDRDWDLFYQLTSFYMHMFRNRSYLFSTSAGGRTIIDSIPGFPRLLVRTSSDKPDAGALFKAFKARHYQLTNGPFVDIAVNDSGPGDVHPVKGGDCVKVRITAPSWDGINSISFDKEGESQKKLIVNLEPGATQIIPDNSDHEVYQIDLSELNLDKEKDTLLNIQVQNQHSISQFIYGGAGGPDIKAYCLTYPITLDLNNNKKFDTPPLTWKGR